MAVTSPYWCSLACPMRILIFASLRNCWDNIDGWHRLGNVKHDAGMITPGETLGFVSHTFHCRSVLPVSTLTAPQGELMWMVMSLKLPFFCCCCCFLINVDSQKPATAVVKPPEVSWKNLYQTQLRPISHALFLMQIFQKVKREERLRRDAAVLWTPLLEPFASCRSLTPSVCSEVSRVFPWAHLCRTWPSASLKIQQY